MPNLNIIKLITLKDFEILTPKADIRQKLSFYYRPKFNLGTEWNQEKYWSSLQDSFFTGSNLEDGFVGKNFKVSFTSDICLLKEA